MIEAVVPYFCVNVAERSESTGMADDPAMLWASPRQWPISCAAT